MRYEEKIFFLCILILLTTACGRGDSENEVILTPDGLIQRTLTIQGSDNFRFVVEQARNALNKSWQERGYNYYLSINFKRHESVDRTNPQASREIIETRLRIELMAGMGADLIFSEDFTLHPFAQSGFLTDFYTLIDNCNVLSRDDFFINALKANEFRGGLYELPMIFGFHYIGINDNMPDSILDRFTEFSYLRISDMIGLYFDFLDNYPDNFLHMMNFSSLHRNPTFLNIMNYIDLDTNTVDLSSPCIIERFVLRDRIDYSVHDGFHITMGINTVDIIRPLAGTHMFYGVFWSFNPVDVFIEREIPFSHFIPLANDHGSLVVDFGFWAFYGTNTVNPRIWMPTAGNTLLAWEFTHYLIIAFSEAEGMAATIPGFGRWLAPWGSNSFHVPIMRSLFESNIRATFAHIDYTLDRFFDYFYIQFDEEELERGVQNALERIYKYANMPMVIGNPHLPMHLIMQPLRDFANGLISSQEAIARAENAMTLWLME